MGKSVNKLNIRAIKHVALGSRIDYSQDNYDAYIWISDNRDCLLNIYKSNRHIRSKIPSAVIDICNSYLESNKYCYNLSEFRGWLYDCSSKIKERDIQYIKNALLLCLLTRLSQEAEKMVRGEDATVQVVANCICSARDAEYADEAELSESASRIEHLFVRRFGSLYSMQSPETRQYIRRKIYKKAGRMGMADYEYADKYLSQCNDVLPGREFFGRGIACKWIYPALVVVAAIIAGVVLTISMYKYTWYAVFISLPLILLFISISIELLDRILTLGAGQYHYARLDYCRGIPEESRTMAVIPALVFTTRDIERVGKQIELCKATNKTQNLNFAMLLDCLTNDSKEREELFSKAKEVVVELNNKYAGGGKPVFCALMRKNPVERKRGALIDLCKLLQGEPGPDFMSWGYVEQEYTYICVVDEDTNTDPESIKSLVACADHPFNKPVLSKDIYPRVISGYGIVSPTISPTRKSCTVSGYASLMYGYAGFTDLYASNVGSPDSILFGNGIFTGKGLIHIRTYLDCTEQTLPHGRILSHDQLEGAIMRTAVLGDVHFRDNCPSTILSDFARKHRWTRGDWQLMPWLFPKAPTKNGSRTANSVSLQGRYRMFTNMLYELRGVLLIGLLIGGTFAVPHRWPLLLELFLGVSYIDTIALLLSYRWWRGLIIEAWRIVSSGAVRHFPQPLWNFMMSLTADTYKLLITPFRAYMLSDAILRSIWRMTISHKNLMEWKTSTASAKSDYKIMIVAQATVSLIFAISAVLFNIAVVQKIVYFALATLFLLGIPMAVIMDRDRSKIEATDREKEFPEELARRIWAYFDFAVSPKTNWIPPDNIQTGHFRRVIYITSPTNIGMYLLSTISAYYLHIIQLDDCIRRIERTVNTLEAMPKWKGHIYNWVDCLTLEVAEPKYVSTVDSGNLCCCLIAILGFLRSEGNGPRKYDSLISRIETLVSQMDFEPLYNRDKSLLSIGYSISKQKQDGSCYDLAASEAMMTVYMCCAKKKMPLKLWKSLSRRTISAYGYCGPASWSGTMFEYLMPFILLPAQDDTFVMNQIDFAVKTQITYGVMNNIPWGMSECGYYAYDKQGRYSYKAIGLKATALNRQARNEKVIAPYASIMTMPYYPQEVNRNLQQLKDYRMYGKWGFYEALDMETGNNRIVEMYMSHHQGMALASIANYLCQNQLVKCMCSDSDIAAYVSLLEYRTPGAPEGSIVEYKAVAPHRIRTNYEPWKPKCGANGTIHSNILTSGTHSLITNGDGSISLMTKDIVFGKSGCDHGDMYLTINGNKPLVTRCEFGETRSIVDMISAGVSVKMSAVVAGNNAEILYEITSRKSSGRVCAQMSIRPIVDRYLNYKAHPAFSLMFVNTHHRAGENKAIITRKNRENSSNYAGQIYVCDSKGVVRIDVEDGLYGRVTITEDVYLAREERIYLKVVIGLVPNTILDLNYSITGNSLLQLSDSVNYAEKLQMDNKTAMMCRTVTGLIFSNSHLLSKWTGGNAGGISSVWQYGISGDLPVILIRCQGVCQYVVFGIQLAMYARGKGIAVDLVIVVDEEDQYSNKTYRTIWLEIADRIGSRFDSSSGSEYILDSAKLGENYNSLSYISSVELRNNQDMEDIIPTIEGLEDNVKQYSPSDLTGITLPLYESLWQKNSYGGYLGNDGSRYCVINRGRPEHNPWCNCISGENCGIVTGDRNMGYFWYRSSRDFRITHLLNEPGVEDSSEKLWITDRETKTYVDCCPGEDPSGTYYTVHGVDFTSYITANQVFESQLQVRLSDICSAKINRLTIINRGERNRRFGIRYQISPALCGAGDRQTRLKFIKQDNFCLINAPMSHNNSDVWVCIGTNADAVFNLSKGTPVFTLSLDLAAGHEATVKFVIACGIGSKEAVKNLQNALSENAYISVPEHIEHSPKVNTPSKYIDSLVNYWLIHQIRDSRLLGRTGWYQSGGAIGYRDRLQDSMAYMYVDSDFTRRVILEHACRQFREGDVQHWWNPDTGAGIRTNISDDLLFLPYVTAEYVRFTGDTDILHEQCTWLVGRDIEKPGKDDYYIPEISEDSDNLYSHCISAINRACRFGKNGLPLIGSGDWNDGMNRIGINGKGESVWLGWFLAMICGSFAPYCAHMGDQSNYDKLLSIKGNLEIVLNTNAWNGRWFLRAINDMGEPIGSAESEECRIDSLSQSFATISGLGNDKLAKDALNSAYSMLFDKKNGLIKLLDPPFSGLTDPGYIADYPPGIRENGGQYTHGACWLIIAHFLAGEKEKALEMLFAILPGNHTSSDKEVLRYRVEPYVVAADVYSSKFNEGMGGWTWYTGSASWLYQTLIKYMLGIDIAGNEVHLEPRVPDSWSQYDVSMKIAGAQVNMHFVKTEHSRRIICNGIEVGTDTLPVNWRRGDRIDVDIFYL